MCSLCFSLSLRKCNGTQGPTSLLCILSANAAYLFMNHLSLWWQWLPLLLMADMMGLVF